VVVWVGVISFLFSGSVTGDRGLRTEVGGDISGLLEPKPGIRGTCEPRRRENRGSEGEGQIMLCPQDVGQGGKGAVGTLPRVWGGG